jgi:hypothetical protein
MLSPLEIDFHNVHDNGSVESRIRQELAELEKFYNRFLSCRVDVEMPPHERRGSVSTVQIDFGLPPEDAARAEERGAAAKEDGGHMKVKSQHKDASMAVHAAFNTARRHLAQFLAAPEPSVKRAKA